MHAVRGSVCDVAVVGAGAAGLATAIFIRRTSPDLDVFVFDGARSPGAKILVSGGSRCNVTNTIVSERDFTSGSPAIVRRVLRAFPPEATRRFFAELGVVLHEEAHGKLFPVSNRSRDVLNALLSGLSQGGGVLQCGHRVQEVTAAVSQPGFDVVTSRGTVRSRAVVLATGGLSLPKTGSDGLGYELARRLGHTIVETTPALVPLTFEKDIGWHGALSGVSLPVRLRVEAAEQRPVDIRGSLLFTHFGASGPAVLDASRHWLRHRLEGRVTTIRMDLIDEPFEAAEARWIEAMAQRPRQRVGNAVAALVPAAVAERVMAGAGIPRDRTLATLTRPERRALLHALTEWTLPVDDSRGYNYAEVTAGGVPLHEIDPATMESRLTPGLYFAGEILDVDGRLGGFNFQWAWASAFVAGRALARRAGTAAATSV
jgi:predicted Rossmann fold flavoprotein